MNLHKLVAQPSSHYNRGSFTVLLGFRVLNLKFESFLLEIASTFHNEGFPYTVPFTHEFNSFLKCMLMYSS